jgi:hypothetical protein
MQIAKNLKQSAEQAGRKSSIDNTFNNETINNNIFSSSCPISSVLNSNKNNNITPTATTTSNNNNQVNCISPSEGISVIPQSEIYNFDKQFRPLSVESNKSNWDPTMFSPTSSSFSQNDIIEEMDDLMQDESDDFDNPGNVINPKLIENIFTPGDEFLSLVLKQAELAAKKDEYPQQRDFETINPASSSCPTNINVDINGSRSSLERSSSRNIVRKDLHDKKRRHHHLSERMKESSSFKNNQSLDFFNQKLTQNFFF